MAAKPRSVSVATSIPATPNWPSWLPARAARGLGQLGGGRRARHPEIARGQIQQGLGGQQGWRCLAARKSSARRPSTAGSATRSMVFRLASSRQEVLDVASAPGCEVFRDAVILRGDAAESARRLSETLFGFPPGVLRELLPSVAFSGPLVGRCTRGWIHPGAVDPEIRGGARDATSGVHASQRALTVVAIHLGTALVAMTTARLHLEAFRTTCRCRRRRLPGRQEAVEVVHLLSSDPPARVAVVLGRDDPCASTARSGRWLQRGATIQ
ncbi:hypothetical protein SMICM17S_04988 [Streptomyces microflavus]